MYQDYFGISENPFSIIPDPHYLYMSQRHQEALAHLLYGVGESGGFVLLTGEVGTGKTTISRALMEQLPEHTDLALILNPKLSEIEMLAAICDEMRISYPLGTVSLKEFFDALNEHLLKSHAAGRNPVLMIDEAQNLSSEALELVRLLTNLETKDKKLLQIILVGQPELNHLLALAENRQTAQRITARYHLEPLNLLETRAYVIHRLKVAGLDTRVFTNTALKIVYKASRGIPRLINSICDRALLAAYVEGRKEIDAKMARRASEEVHGKVAQTGLKGSLAAFVFAIALTGALVLGVFDPYHWGVKDGMASLGAHIEQLFKKPEADMNTETTPAPAPPAADVASAPMAEEPPAPRPAPVEDVEEVEVVAPSETAAPEALAQPDDVPIEKVEAEVKFEDAEMPAPPPPPPPAPTPHTKAEKAEAKTIVVAKAEGTLIGDFSQTGTPDTAFVQLFKLWNLDYLTLDGLTPCDKATATALLCKQGQTDVYGLKTINRPMVVSLNVPGVRRLYGVVSVIEQNSMGDIITIDFGERTESLNADTFRQYWPGDYLVMWKPPEPLTQILERGSQGPEVVELRRLLDKVGYGGERVVPDEDKLIFDSALQERLQRFQTDLGLEVDGVAGTETVMRLTGIAGETFGPRIRIGED